MNEHQWRLRYDSKYAAEYAVRRTVNSITQGPRGIADTLYVSNANPTGVNQMFTTDKFHNALCATIALSLILAAMVA